MMGAFFSVRRTSWKAPSAAKTRARRPDLAYEESSGDGCHRAERTGRSSG
jgi:hypothetical protein